VGERFTDEHGEPKVKPGLAVFLDVITLGIYGLVATYRIMRFWWQIQLTEQDFDEKLSVIWAKIGIVRYPLTFEPIPEMNRSFGMHFFLSVVTIGIYAMI